VRLIAAVSNYTNGDVLCLARCRLNILCEAALLKIEDARLSNVRHCWCFDQEEYRYMPPAAEFIRQVMMVAPASCRCSFMSTVFPFCPRLLTEPFCGKYRRHDGPEMLPLFDLCG
jgi:hypothetical protein